MGEPAPELNADAMIHDGQSALRPSTLKNFDGKVILLDFWNVDCSSCITGFPRLTELEQEYGKRGLIVIGVTPFKKLKWSEKLNAPIPDELATVDQELEALLKFARNYQATHRLLIVSKKQQEQLNEKFGVVGNPFAFLIDRKGFVRKSACGSIQIASRDFEKIIQKLLDEN